MNYNDYNNNNNVESFLLKLPSKVYVVYSLQQSFTVCNLYVL